MFTNLFISFCVSRWGWCTMIYEELTQRTNWPRRQPTDCLDLGYIHSLWFNHPPCSRLMQAVSRALVLSQRLFQNQMQTIQRSRVNAAKEQRVCWHRAASGSIRRLPLWSPKGVHFSFLSKGVLALPAWICTWGALHPPSPTSFCTCLDCRHCL